MFALACKMPFKPQSPTFLYYFTHPQKLALSRFILSHFLLCLFLLSLPLSLLITHPSLCDCSSLSSLKVFDVRTVSTGKRMMRIIFRPPMEVCCFSSGLALCFSSCFVFLLSVCLRRLTKQLCWRKKVRQVGCLRRPLLRVVLQWRRSGRRMSQIRVMRRGQKCKHT